MAGERDEASCMDPQTPGPPPHPRRGNTPRCRGRQLVNMIVCEAWQAAPPHLGSSANREQRGDNTGGHGKHGSPRNVAENVESKKHRTSWKLWSCSPENVDVWNIGEETQRDTEAHKDRGAWKNTHNMDNME
ncbi:hypothetical protein NHX12_010756 [Muraenolepis orangiensis]|uniref:Uncharacterized protein n=1 Tax=Muraenolepis orangiensis TaxID=630683 RepID=A0A9Q0I995_9TELE|nr:hypothetical protein NHX12_010756 [Muraenolepis orangiensis]